MEEKNNQQKYISLADATKLCSYSEPYLRLRSRQGKLKSIKLGKKWMTTAAWLDDYDTRVQEWKQTMAEKKCSSPQAVFVAAPDELSKVVAACEKDCSGHGKEITDDSVKSDSPKAVFCDNKYPADEKPLFAPSPRKQIRLERAGQIFPSPKDELPAAVSNHNWFGAFLSGVVCALMLFLAAGQDIAPGTALNALGQAKLSGLLEGDASALRAAEQPMPEKNDYQPLQLVGSNADISDDSLKELVKKIADFINGY